MASQPSWKYYKKLSDMSRLRAIAESVFNNRNYGSSPRFVSAAEAYAMACKLPWVTVTDLPMDKGAIKNLGLPDNAKVINDNCGATVGRSAEARVFYNRCSAAEKNNLEAILREAMYSMERNNNLVIAEAVVGMDPKLMIKARLIAPENDIANVFHWYANFSPLASVPGYEKSTELPIQDILFVSYPDWTSPDPRWAKGCVAVDEEHMTIYNLGMRYFGERKKGTLTMAWTAGMRLGMVSAHAGIKEIDFTKVPEYSKRGKQVIAFYGLSGSGKSSHTNALDNAGTLPKGATRRIAHDDAFQIDGKTRTCYVWEPTLYDKTDHRDTSHPDWKYCISTQNMMVVEVDGKIIPAGEDIRNNNGRALFSRELLGTTTNSIGFPNHIGWLMKDSTLPPILKLTDPDLAVAMGATLMTKRTSAENVSAEEMKKLVFVPFANPFRVYPLYCDCLGYEKIFQSGCACYVWSGGGGGMWNGSDTNLKKVPLEVSLTLQTAVLEGTLEWENWALVKGAQIPTRDSIEKILPGYYDMYNPNMVPNLAEFMGLLKDRFQQRKDFIAQSDIAEQPELMQRLISSLQINA
ncbi:MAG: phosphoenolpyruvate carboxykinase (ATP) [Desulfovibrionaceae bacterium]|nr:phosphoenolpyruvate carboxykinase (ATP) [Desulfovibrionaceae bacterium]MBR5734702.1 phosphoenolpyruvate carboxykinase (ATP) [Desulfovibrionaceae bacterium]